MICSKLLKHPYVDRERYRSLSPDGRDLIVGWYQKAQKMKGVQGKACFEAFFDVWVAFNGWAVCVTDEDKDIEYIDALKRDTQLCQEFKRFTIGPESSLASATQQFAEFWPIFDVRKLRKRSDIRVNPEASRADTVRLYLRRNINSFAPECGKEHLDAGESIPTDWPHTLSALYQVRCNFFHGGKMLSSEEDQRIVSAAYMTLLTFLEQGRYLV